ncbi:MAG: type II toxin-antitoxin system VapC family toxin [Treponema sp.]|nr:type II toxin-antitoxin system VapC family toxin [Treponema sp.]
MVYVLDSSFIGAVIIPDEKNPRAEEMYMQIINSDEKYVPHLFFYEMANIFMNLLRRKRYSYDAVVQLSLVLSSIRLRVDSETGIEFIQKLLRLCNEYNISSYDAAYLELAERTNAVLCTLDEDLRAAAEKRGVTLMK